MIMIDSCGSVHYRQLCYYLTLNFSDILIGPQGQIAIYFTKEMEIKSSCNKKNWSIKDTKLIQNNLKDNYVCAQDASSEHSI